jgi:hypothetical protein
MTQDHHPEQLTADELAIFRTDALLDAILDGRPGRSRTTCGSCSPAASASTGEPATHPGPSDQLGAHRPGAGPRRRGGHAPGPAMERRPRRGRLRR